MQFSLDAMRQITIYKWKAPLQAYLLVSRRAQKIITGNCGFSFAFQRTLVTLHVFMCNGASVCVYLCVCTYRHQKKPIITGSAFNRTLLKNFFNFSDISMTSGDSAYNQRGDIMVKTFFIIRYSRTQPKVKFVTHILYYPSPKLSFFGRYLAHSCYYGPHRYLELHTS